MNQADHALGWLQFKQTEPMTTELLIDNLANQYGRIAWDDACVLAKGHGLLDDLIEDFGNLENYGRGLNAELLAHWLGY